VTTEPDVAVEAGRVPAPARTLVAANSIRAYGMRPLVVLFVLNMIDEFDRAVLAVSLDRIRDHFRLSDATAGLLPLAVIFITGLLSLPAGNLADRLSRTKLLAYGSIVWGGAGMLAAGAQSFFQLFLTRALLGVGQGTINPTHASLLSDYYPVSVRGRVLGYHRSANPLGQVVGAVIGGAIVAAVGWRWGFVAAAVPGLLLGVLALTLREPKRGESDLQAAVDGNPLLAEFLREPTDRWGFRRSLGTIFRIRTLRYLIFTNAAFGFTLFGIVFWLPALFERRYGFETQEAGAAFGALALCGFIGTWFGGPLADRNVRRGFAYVARIGIAACATVTVTWTLGFAIPVAGITLFLIAAGGFLASLGIPGLTALIAACAPPRIRSQAFAAFGLALAVCGAAAAPLAVGGLSEFFQRQYGVNEGDALRYAMVIASATVMSLGTWLVYQASRSAAADAQRVMADFIAERTGRAT
jgi:MFS family permease